MADCVRNNMDGSSRLTAVFSLLAGALVWGLIWYPYRALRDAGVDGIWASTLTYAVAFVLGLFLFRRALQSWKWKRADRAKLFWLAISAAGCNLCYVLATLDGEVVRVLLLFYLAPLWTVLLSHILLGERLSRIGALVVLLSLAGAATILWHRGVGVPLPRDAADWLGLSAGFSFALFNVLSRYARDVPIEIRSMVSFVGVVVVGAVLVVAGQGTATVPEGTGMWTLIGLVAVVLAVINLVVQYGLSRMAANRAIVIMLSEVGIAALSAWLLAGESFGWRETIGGVMIVTAAVFSARMESGSEAVGPD